MNRGNPPRHLKKGGYYWKHICKLPPPFPSYPWNSKANKN